MPVATDTAQSLCPGNIFTLSHALLQSSFSVDPEATTLHLLNFPRTAQLPTCTAQSLCSGDIFTLIQSLLQSSFNVDPETTTPHLLNSPRTAQLPICATPPPLHTSCRGGNSSGWSASRQEGCWERLGEQSSS